MLGTIGVLILQYYVFLMLFPDGEFGTIREILNTPLEIIFRPASYLDGIVYEIFGGHANRSSFSTEVAIIYVYALSVLIANCYELVVENLD
ncbi:hypothetical protein [Halovivax gelatinilyticus]|uniref:hypothetical protein n=1 Tax=Halovivax gelatinilyticus TaxID=2961597 RepID=UPI0020CA68E6|nr:hypothetical protein [Halovivax gelatinilyticus]